MRPSNSTLVLVLVAATAACSLPRDEGVRLDIDLRDHSSSSISGLGNGLVLQGAGGLSTASLPLYANMFDCFAVNVQGPGISGHNPANGTRPDDPHQCRYPAITSEILSAASGTLSTQLTVPSGPQRLIQVIGLFTNGQGCPAGNLEEVMRNSGQSIIQESFELGYAISDLYEDTVVDISNTYDSSSPVPAFGGCGPVPIAAIAAGDSHTCVVADNEVLFDSMGYRMPAGSVYCFGDNSFGQLGDGTTTQRKSPVRVIKTDGTPLTGVFRLGSGANHVCAVSREIASGIDTLYCWGKNSFGQLGDGTLTNRSSAAAIYSGGAGMSLGDVVGGDNHTCFSNDSNTIQCMGNDQFGQIGDNASNVACAGTSCSSTPLTVTGLAGGGVLAAGANHTCVSNGSTVYCWGAGTAGQLGSATASDSDLGTAVVGLSYQIRGIAAGGNSTCAVAEDVTPVPSDFRIYCWGENSDGQLGDGTFVSKTSATQILLQSTPINGISLGAAHTCAQFPGAAKCWGRNTSGQLGTGNTTGTNVPIGLPTGSQPVWSLVAGGSLSNGFTCFSLAGALKCTGANGSGQFGNGGTSGSLSPKDSYIKLSW